LAGKDTGTVLVSGDAQRVWLESGGKKYNLGTVPAGKYAVLADFGNGTGYRVAEIEVVKGAVVRIRCSGEDMDCR
jgi:hypothetical protein